MCTLFLQILCGTIHPLVTFYSIIEMLVQFKDKVSENPVVFLRVVDRSLSVFYSIVFYTGVWVRESNVSAIFTSGSPNQTSRKVCCCKLKLIDK